MSYTPEQRREYEARWRKTEKGKASIRAKYDRWVASKRGRAIKRKCNDRYSNTERGRIAHRAGRKRYRATAKGIATQARFVFSAKGRALAIRGRSRRRARERGVFTYRFPGDFDLVLNRWKNACAYCGSTLFKLTEDHVIPISWGGHDAIWNLVPACVYCNATKNARYWAVIQTNLPPCRNLAGVTIRLESL